MVGIKQKDYFTQNLFFSQKDGCYYALELQSELSGKLIQNMGVIFMGWSNTKSIGCNFLIVDESEYEKARLSFGSKAYEDFRQGIVVLRNIIPFDAVSINYTIRPNSGSKGVNNMDCFQIADEEMSLNGSAHKHLVSSKPCRNKELCFVDGKKLLALKDKELEKDGLDLLEYKEGEKE